MLRAQQQTEATPFDTPTVLCAPVGDQLTATRSGREPRRPRPRLPPRPRKHVATSKRWLVVGKRSAFRGLVSRLLCHRLLVGPWHPRGLGTPRCFPKGSLCTPNKPAPWFDCGGGFAWPARQACCCRCDVRCTPQRQGVLRLDTETPAMHPRRGVLGKALATVSGWLARCMPTASNGQQPRGQ